ncbi:uncharacterized protein LOC131314395 isoform X1 [Rhododendron vialii]|uniref:uncharacterized protein LOC131314395 isoform X1 n=1 Tax=Rhododendron vialii TaxID=182163 RepID=UPI00265E1E99|nr:uncharacterized protein LOC131314395 isoform X1 [Rhododendron vialii]
MVVHKQTHSRRRRSRSPVIGRYEASPRKRGRRSKSRTPERRASSRKGRSRDRSSTPEKEGTRKHHRDRYEKPDADWAKATAHKSKEFEDGTVTAREAARKALSNIAASPFAKRLQEARLLSRVKHGTFVLYETNTDPVAHIQHYQQAMFMHEGDDAILCKMFPSSLGKVALAWFHKLGPRSIRGWRQLAEEFTTRFLTSRKVPKTFESLSTMKQEENEQIRDYAKKYWETFNEIESCSEEYAIATFKTGLPVRGELRRSLNKHPVATLAKLMERIEQHARMEEDILREDGRMVAE